jgi:hypothetical protein
MHTAKKDGFELIHREPTETNSLFFSSIDDAINQENQVRLDLL